MIKKRLLFAGCIHRKLVYIKLTDIYKHHIVLTRISMGVTQKNTCYLVGCHTDFCENIDFCHQCI